MSPALTTGRLGDRVICDPMARSSSQDRPNPYVFSDPSDREGARLRLMASLLDRLEPETATSGSSASQVIVEKILDDGHHLHGGPLPGLRAVTCEPAVPGAGQQIAGAVSAGRAQGFVQGQSLSGRDDAVIVAVQEQERGGTGP